MYIFSLNIDLLIKKSVLFKKLIFQQKYVYLNPPMQAVLVD